MNHGFNEYTRRCLDDSFSGGLRTLACNGTTYQEWKQIYTQNGSVLTLKNIKTGRCLDDSLPHGLRAIPCNGTRHQQFFPEAGGPGHGGSVTDRLYNSATARCVDDSFSGGLRAHKCNNTGYQVWNFLGLGP